MAVAWLSHDSHITILCKWHGSDMAVTWLLHGSHMAVTWKWHGSDMAVTWQWHGSDMAVTWQSHNNYMQVTWQLHGSYTVVAWQLHSNYMQVTWQLHGSDMAVTWQWHGSYMAVTWQWHGSDKYVSHYNNKTPMSIERNRSTCRTSLKKAFYGSTKIHCSSHFSNLIARSVCIPSCAQKIKKICWNPSLRGGCDSLGEVLQEMQRKALKEKWLRLRVTFLEYVKPQLWKI